MGQPFQFDVFGAPPADIGPGIAAYSQGMGNAAQLYAQRGQMFEGLREAASSYAAMKHQRTMAAKALAQDYQQFQATHSLREKEFGAEEAYRKEKTSLDKARMEAELGWRTSAAETARRNADLRERGLDLEASRGETSRLAEQRQREALAQKTAIDAQRADLARQVEARAQANALAQQAVQRRLQAMAQLKMMGDPQAILGEADGSVQRGESERMLRDLFRGLGGEAPPQAPGPIQHPADRGQAKAAEPDQAAAEVALANEIAAQAKAKGWSREEARAAYLKAARAAGID